MPLCSPSARVAQAALAASLAFAALVPAQSRKSRGPFAGARHGLSVDGATCTIDRAEVWAKRGGNTSQRPEQWPGRSPDYRIASIVGASLATQIDVDAMSVGRDLIHADTNGVLQPPPPPRWAALTFSVTRGTRGAFGPILAESGAADGASADLFAWHVRRRLLGGITNRVELAQDSLDINSGCTPAIGDMDAHDMHMAASIGGARHTLGYTTAEFYFSITSATASAAPASWFGPDGRSGATILLATWDGSRWSAIAPFLTWRDLGLQQDDDVDALAVSKQSGGPNEWILFSTRSALPDPILIHSVSPRVGPQPYRVQDGVNTPTVSSVIGIRVGGADDIDAICALDPEDGGEPFYRYMLGSPVDSSFVWPLPFPRLEDVHASSPQDAAGLWLWLNGCPPLGCAGGGFALLAITDTRPVGAAPIVTVPFTRLPGQSGIEFPIAIPPATPVRGFSVDLHWLVADPTLTSLDSSTPLRVNL